MISILLLHFETIDERGARRCAMYTKVGKRVCGGERESTRKYAKSDSLRGECESSEEKSSKNDF